MYMKLKALMGALTGLIIPCSAVGDSGNIERRLVRQSVSQSICLSGPSAFLCDGWMDFLHIWYHGTQCGPTDARPIIFYIMSERRHLFPTHYKYITIN